MDELSIRTSIAQIAQAGLTATVLESACAAEPRWWRKRRLLALECLAKGGTMEAACAFARADQLSVEKWLMVVGETGLSALEAPQSSNDFYRDQLAARKAELIHEIGIALQHASDIRERVRLQAICRVFTGEDEKTVAQSMGICTRSIIDWQKRTLRCGVESLRARKRASSAAAAHEPH